MKTTCVPKYDSFFCQSGETWYICTQRMKMGNFHPLPPNTHQLEGIQGHWPFWCGIKILCAWASRSRVQIYLPSPQLTKLVTNTFKTECLHSSNSLYMRRVTLNGRLQLLAYPHGTSKHQCIFSTVSTTITNSTSSKIIRFE